MILKDQENLTKCENYEKIECIHPFSPLPPAGKKIGEKTYGCKITKKLNFTVTLNLIEKSAIQIHFNLSYLNWTVFKTILWYQCRCIHPVISRIQLTRSDRTIYWTQVVRHTLFFMEAFVLTNLQSRDRH